MEFNGEAKGMNVRLKKKLTVILSILLAVCTVMMILPTLIKTSNAMAETPVYYVKADGDDANDGKSEAKPKKTIGGAITQMQLDGFDNVGQEVIVKVMRLENEPTTWADANGSAKFVDYFSSAIGHKATITYTSLDETNYSTIAYFNEFGNNSRNLNILGPTVFEKINLLDQRTDGATKSIFSHGFDVSFRDCVHLINSNPGNAFASLSGRLNAYTGVCGYVSGNQKVSGVGTLRLQSYAYDNVVLGGMIDNEYSYSNTVTGETNVIIEGGSIKKLKLSDYSSGASACCPVYNGNVNFTAYGDTTISSVLNGVCNGTSIVPIVNGAINIVLNDTATIAGGTISNNFNMYAYSNAEKTEHAPIFVINNNSGLENVVSAVSGEIGVFNTDGVKAYFYPTYGDQTTVYYGTGRVTLPESGEYSVRYDESLLPTPTMSDDKYGDYEFDKYVDNGDGTMTATFKLKTAKVGEYYVLSGGTGLEPTGTLVGLPYDATDNELGRSADKPLATVKDAINLINADGMTHVDDVTVYIMQLPYTSGWWDNTSSLALSPLTSWSDDVKNFASIVPTHEAVIKIKTYNYNGTNNYLGYTNKLGQNADLMLGGPVVFENITLVGMRRDDSVISANGFDITFGDGFDFYNVSADQYANPTWDGTFTKFANFRFEGGTSRTTLGGDGGVITVNGTLVSHGQRDRGLNLSSHYGSYSFTDHVHYILNNSAIDVDLVFGTNTVNYNLLTIDVKQASIVAFANRTLATQNVSNLQVIAALGQRFMSASYNSSGAFYRSNGSINSIPSCVNYTNGWFITLAEGGLLEATDVAGKFKIAEGKVAVATNLSTQLINLSSDGVLDLSSAPANYSIRFVEESEMQDELVPVYFDGVLLGNKMKGETFVLSDKDDTLLQQFSGWNDGTNFYNKGDSYTIAEDFSGISISFASVYKNFDGQEVIFVDELNGSDNNDGTANNKAVKTISKAITLFSRQGSNKKVVGIIGDYTFDESRLQEHTDMIYISGDGNVSNNQMTSKVIIANASCYINGPTTFENINLRRSNGEIDAEDHRLVLGENVVCAENGSNGVFIRAGVANGTFDVEINSGYVYGLYIGSNSANIPTVLGGNITINGGKVLLFYFGRSNVNTIFTGNVNVMINGTGNIQNMAYAIAEYNYSFADTASLQFIVNSNNVAPSYRYQDRVEKYWFISNFYSDTCKIIPTGIVGEFEIVGDKYAVLHYQPQGEEVIDKGTKILAIDENGNPETNVVLARGNWSVKFHENVDYINSLGEITVYKDNTYIDLSKELYKERGIFKGWEVKTKDGEETFVLNADGYYDAGTIITARFIDCDYKDLFFIEGAQIKKSGTQAIRFIIDQNKQVDSVVKQIASTYKFGVVYMKTDLLGGNDLVKGGQYSIDTMAGYYMPDNGRVEGEKITASHQEINSYYKDTATLYKYTFTLDGITDDDLYTFYTIKGYIEYLDLNGNTKVIYTDYKMVNLYKIAKMADADSNTSFTATDKAEFKRIKDYVEIDRELKYFGANGDGSIVGKTTPDGADENHTIYTTKNGLRVRKATIEWDYNDEDTDNVVIVQISDTHFSGIDDVDRLEGSTTTVDTYNEYGYRYPQDAHNAIKVMEYGSMADKIIVTGDIYDSQSHYSMWKTKYLLMDKNVGIDGEARSVLLVTGNHEHTQNTSGVIREIYDLDTRDEIRNDFFETYSNNCVYHSEVMKNSNGYNRAMIILLDNQRDLYYDYLVDFFTADLELARELNIPVLIFQHDPISSNNPNEKNLGIIGEENMGSGNPGGYYNLYDGSGKIGGPNAKTSYPIDGPATQEMYELIVNNSDIIKGIFCGHTHNNYYSEIICPDGSIIPQYILNTTFDISNIASANTSINSGTLMHITIENI